MSKFSKKQLDKIWEKARKIRRKNPDAWRRDDKGNIIRRGSYGTKGKYGWEVDHKKPKARGGTDHGKNLRPLHWRENRKKKDKY